MIRIRRALEVLQVAVHAVRVRARQVVIIVDVALCALQRSMSTGQRESGGRVVEGRAGPGSRVMALGAGLGEAGLHVVRIRSALEVLQVATNASRVGTGQIVVIVDVALRAGNCRMRPSQRETGRRVIECCSRPRCGGVALLTRLRESRCHVVRIRRSLEVLQVTTDASRIGAGQVVVAIHVALRALQRRVSAGQRETGRRVIERRVSPRRGGVALLASRREA